MSALDLARLTRLKSAVDQLAGAKSDGSWGTAAAYMALRSQVLEAVPAGLQGEVSAICPEVSVTGGGGGSLFAAKQSNDLARSYLQSLSGWLQALMAGD